jgi:hypothetical protein
MPRLRRVFSLGAGGRIGRPVSFSPWPSYPALSKNGSNPAEAPAQYDRDMDDLESRMLSDGELVAGSDAGPFGAFRRSGLGPYSRYTGGEPPHGA